MLITNTQMKKITATLLHCIIKTVTYLLTYKTAIKFQTML